VIVTDKPIDPEAFVVYVRLCQKMNTFPADAQFPPDERGLAYLVEHTRLRLQAYVTRFVEVRANPC